MSLVLVIYGIEALQSNYTNPFFQCREGLCNSVYNMIELFIMIRLFPLVLIFAQFCFAFLYLSCCMCGDTSVRIRRRQRLPRINAFLDEHIVPLDRIDPNATDTQCAICLDDFNGDSPIVELRCSRLHIFH